MFSWVILFYIMADVMGLGRGGDGTRDPPNPVGFGRIQHEGNGKYYYDLFNCYFYSFIINDRD